MAGSEAGSNTGSDPATAGAAGLRVEVAAALLPGQVELTRLALPSGSNVEFALRASGLRQRLPEALWSTLALGIWGRTCQPETVLRDGDRIELYRGLQVDPKTARRLRYRRDGLRKPTRQGR